MNSLNISLLTICGLEELDQHVGLPVTQVLSILDPDHPDPVIFGDFPRLSRTVLRFHDVIEPTQGQTLPQREHVEQILAFGSALAAAKQDDAHLLVHCHAGISRSTAAMATLLAQRAPRRPATEILGQIVAMRPRAWPNLRMIELADELLQRDGSLVTAAGRLYALQLERLPHVADYMRNNGRLREVEMGLGARAFSPTGGV